MSKKLLDQHFQESLIKNTSVQLKAYWDSEEVLDQLQKYKRFKLIPEDVANTLKDESHKPLSVFMTQFFINSSYLRDLIEEEDTDELLEFWEGSEFTSLFFDNNEIREEEFLSKSKTCLKKLEKIWVTYLYLYFDIAIEGKLNFKSIPEIGDFENTFYTESGYSLSIQETDSVKTAEEIIENLEEHYFNKEIPVETVLTTNDFALGFRPGSQLTELELDTASKKLNFTLEALSKLTPDLFRTLHSFTHTIIALNIPEMVSFSLQSLPGYSSINLFHRDKVDCFDDLLHENGHHYLNTILNHSDLIVEDPEKDYPSPWRMSYRPIRGIYHGVFTFYWALELFGQLTDSNDLDSYFSNEEISKIHIRYIEEYYRLIYCEESLEIARENELISNEGWNLIQDVMANIKSHSNSVFNLENSLDTKELKKIAQIKDSLESLKETAFH